MSETSPTSNVKFLWPVLQFTLPLILAIIAGYGSVKYATGENQAKVQAMEQQIKDNRSDLNRMIENQITRREMQLYIDQTKADLQDIKEDLRELRKR